MLKPVFQTVNGYVITCLKEVAVGTAIIAALNVTQVNSYGNVRTASDFYEESCVCLQWPDQDTEIGQKGQELFGHGD